MSSTSDDFNPYELLQVKVEATEQEIKTAYRQRSLKVHPDRNPNNPDAARKFHELNQAYELLLDPLRRLALDAKLRIANARKVRFANYDSKRKNLVEELEAREREVKRARVEKEEENEKRWYEEEKIKEGGRKRREQKLNEMKQMQEEAAAKDEERAPPALGPLDTTIRLKYSLSSHPTLTTAAALSAFLAPYGPTDTESIVLSVKHSPNDGKKAKKSTALVPFRKIGHAFAAVCASAGHKGVDIGWADGNEPDILAWLRDRGELNSFAEKENPLAKISLSAQNETKAPLPQSKSKSSGNGVFSSFPETFPNLSNGDPPPHSTSAASGLDYESLTLMRLRQAEKQRLEREIREAEAAE